MAPPTTPSSFLRPPPPPLHRLVRLPPPSASFRVADLLGGRGLCNGEVGIRRELASDSPAAPPSTTSATSGDPAEAPPPAAAADGVDPDAFEKEMMGLTGGFPGGEVGLKDFVAKNPPPPKPQKNKGLTAAAAAAGGLVTVERPRAPELPLFLPGMVVLVTNPNNAYHMYCGIVQRVTDGKVGVLFEGGNWDRLITFDLDELEGREKGPPMVNPKSVLLEALAADLDLDDNEAKDKKEGEEAKKKEEEGTAAAA
ncbi:NAD(P)H-quinone oxidoreductase subunit S, chloroplastic-like [Oryza brachyantha]|uniref:NAD(P)H-quinone oxidoreductase subunit S, chloroplastic-like n=1 Tax=Oryza brachyantha TaxID=4533 RepID=UPI001ADABA21|nr:NAD(P)H-quinone oxidoreductase subunit S, chloroplastic-like [Oryza brachyantha]